MVQAGQFHSTTDGQGDSTNGQELGLEEPRGLATGVVKIRTMKGAGQVRPAQVISRSIWEWLEVDLQPDVHGARLTAGELRYSESKAWTILSGIIHQRVNAQVIGMVESV
jgi:hypothetical protein